MSKKILSIIAAVLSLAWSLLTLAFFGFNSGKETLVGMNVLFIALAAAVIFVAAVLANFAAGKLKEKFGRLVYLPPILLTLIYCIVIPYSPSHDAYDIAAFAEQLYRFGEFREYAAAYTTFTASNRLTLYMYYPFMLLFGNIEAGVRVLNGLLLLGTMFTFAKTASNMFGRRAYFTAMYIYPAICPFVLLSAPYIYLPVIFLLMTALMFISSKRAPLRLISIIFAAAVYILRPIAFGVLLVCIVAYGLVGGFNLKRFLKNLAAAAILMAIAVGAKAGLGAALYNTGLYPYPSLNNSAAVWSLELGTRMQGENTGLCTYSGYDNDGFDEISEGFHEIWEIRGRVDDADTDKLNELQSELTGKITARFFDEVLTSPENLGEFLKAKFINYYRDGYIPYYTTINVNRSNAAQMLYKNHRDRYYLYENMLLIMYHTAAAAMAAYLLWRLIRGKEVQDGLMSAAVLILSCTAVSMVSIVFAEVGKRLMFDIYPPMILTLCFAVGRVTEHFAAEGKKKKHAQRSYKPVISGFMAVMCSLTAAGLYNCANMDIFANARVETDGDVTTIYLGAAYDMSGYTMKVNGEETTLGVTDRIIIDAGDGDVDFCIIETADGREVRISKLRVNSFDYTPAGG